MLEYSVVRLEAYEQCFRRDFGGWLNCVWGLWAFSLNICCHLLRLPRALLPFSAHPVAVLLMPWVGLVSRNWCFGEQDKHPRIIYAQNFHFSHRLQEDCNKFVFSIWPAYKSMKNFLKYWVELEYYGWLSGLEMREIATLLTLLLNRSFIPQALWNINITLFNPQFAMKNKLVSILEVRILIIH